MQDCKQKSLTEHELRKSWLGATAHRIWRLEGKSEYLCSCFTSSSMRNEAKTTLQPSDTFVLHATACETAQRYLQAGV